MLEREANPQNDIARRNPAEPWEKYVLNGEEKLLGLFQNEDRRQTEVGIIKTRRDG